VYRRNLQVLKEKLYANTIRQHLQANCILEDHRDANGRAYSSILHESLRVAEEEGFYVIYQCTPPADTSPWKLDTEEIPFNGDWQMWLNFWSNFITEYADHDNLGVEIWNEAGRDDIPDYLDGVAKTITHIRRLSNILIAVNFDYGHAVQLKENGELKWIAKGWPGWLTDPRLNGENILRDVHGYVSLRGRKVGQDDYNYTYSDIRQAWVHAGLIDAGVPILIGEWAPRARRDVWEDRDYLAGRNVFQLITEQGMSHIYYSWSHWHNEGGGRGASLYDRNADKQVIYDDDAFWSRWGHQCRDMNQIYADGPDGDYVTREELDEILKDYASADALASMNKLLSRRMERIQDEVVWP